MKYLIITISFLFFFLQSTRSQELKKNKPIKAGKAIEQIAQDTTKKKLCPKDSTECKNAEKCQKKKRNNDKFIDKDSDGLNDERCKGMGFGGGKKRAGKCCGKK